MFFSDSDIEYSSGTQAELECSEQWLLSRPSECNLGLEQRGLLGVGKLLGYRARYSGIHAQPGFRTADQRDSHVLFTLPTASLLSAALMRL